MSNDLISRKAVIEAVDKHTREDGALNDDISVILEEVETAFDKRKVLEEIYTIGRRWCRSASSEEECDDCGHGALMNAVIEIVEKGGVG